MKTPIYYKTEEPFKWPDDPFFYLVAKEGIYQCRNNPFFKSCTLAKSVSGVLPHKETLTSKYPRVPKSLFQRVVGFFDYIARKHDAEAIVLIVFNTQTKQVELVCPEQWVESWPSSWNKGEWYSAADVKYKVPALPPHLIQIGDIHSHINFSAYHSHTDTTDEKHRPGLHIVVGKIKSEPPDMCAQIVVDGVRFDVDDMEEVIEPYEERGDFPQEWLQHFSIKKLKESPWKHTSTGYKGGTSKGKDDSKAYEAWQSGREWMD